MLKSLTDFYHDHTQKVSDKWSIYLTTYERIFTQYRTLPVCLLEIGIQNGGSLEIWSKYFENGRHFIGCDSDERCGGLYYDDNRISVVIGDANTDSIEEKILRINRNLDIVIDDGSHKSSDIVSSFSRYFRHINSGGIYIAEDLHCSYWEQFEGGLFDPRSSISFFKLLADIINHEHWGVPHKRSWLLQNFAEIYGIVFDEETLQEIHAIEFVNSVCIVRKAPAPENILGRRILAGGEPSFISGHEEFDGTLSVAQDQTHNQWANFDILTVQEMNSKNEQIAKLHSELAVRDDKINILNASCNQYNDCIENLNITIKEREKNIATYKLEKISLLETIQLNDMQLSNLYSSRSWRLTKPLRYGAGLARHIANALRNFKGLYR